MDRDVLGAARLAACAELGWQDANGGLHAIAFTPLVIDDTVVAALPFDRTATARLLTGARAATVVLSDSRLALRGWSARAQPVRPTVTADRDGDWTWTGALDQEVRKHPPSRLLIDTPIQRREHWWYVPRWLVRLEPAGPAEPIARRGGPDDAVVFECAAQGEGERQRAGGRGSQGEGERQRAGGRGTGSLRVWTTAVDDWQAPHVGLTALDQSVHLEDDATATLLFTHDFSIPDMELWSCHEVVGARRGRRLTVETRRGSATLEPPGGVLKRLSRHWRRERACRRALASYDGVSPAAAT